MFQDNQILGVILAILLLMFMIITSIIMTRNLILDDKVSFLAVMCVIVLLGVWTVDTIIAFKTKLLEPDEKKFIAQIISNVIFYILGTRKSSKTKQDGKDS